MNFNDGQFFKRKVEDPGNRDNCPRMKRYMTHYGGWACCGLLSVVALFIMIINLIDLFGGPKDIRMDDNRGRGRNDNRGGRKFN